MLRHNRIHWILSVSLFLFLISAVVPGYLYAQGAPATIKGLIKDKESGEMLDYANILMEGTTRGTMSLGGGVFYFNGMLPGTYTIKVLYLGYAPMAQTVTVKSGEVVELSFVLETVIVETLQAYDIEGAEYMIDVTSSTNKHTIGTETFEKFAIDSVEEGISKQAGVVLRAGQLYIRGGRSGETSVQIDGVAVDNPLSNGSLEVSTLALESINVVTGGLDAKYGNALSGVVEYVTKEGGEKFGGGVRYLTNDFGRQDKTFTNYDRLEYQFGGPTPVKGLTYSFAGDFAFDDQENTSVAHRPEYKVKLGGTTLFKFRRRQVNQAKGSIKLAYKLDQGKKVTAEYSYSNSFNERYAPNWSVNGYAKRLIYMPQVIYRSTYNDWLATGSYIPVYYGPWYETMHARARNVMVVDERNSSELRQSLPVLEVRNAQTNELETVVAQVGYDGYRYNLSSFSTIAQDSSYTEFNSANNMVQYKNIGQVGKVVWRHQLDETTFYTVRLGLVAFDSKNTVNDKDPWQYNHGGVWSPGLFFGENRLYQPSRDYYSDPLSPYYITTSDENFYLEEYARTYSLGMSVVSSRWKGHLVEGGIDFRYNDLQRYSLSNPSLMRKNQYTDQWSQGGSRNIFHTYNPEGSWYLQDRWEHEGMVVNYGLRWDLFSPGSNAEILVNNEEIDRNVTKYKTSFSPRLGFAFPITERDAFNFHYGRFVKFPTRDFLFASQDPIGSNGILGNPNLQPETTMAYSAGIVHQFTDYIALQFSLYSRDIFDLIATTQVTDTTTGLALQRQINQAYASARGIELTLSKRFSDHYSFNFAYTYAFADGVSSSSAFGSNPDGLEYLPSQELPLNWDQRHTLNLMVLFSELRVWAASFDFSYGSGFPWTPTDRFAKKQDPMLVNSERLPATFQLGVQLSREINLWGKTLSLQLQAKRLLDQDVVNAVGGYGISPGMKNGAGWAGSAYATDTGKFGGALLYDEDGDGENEYIPFLDPRTFGLHREFRIGVGYYF